MTTRATTCVSCWPPTEAPRCCPSPRSPPAASWPGPCWPCASCCWAEPDRGAGTLVFDEVDAGIGGQSALAVGRALAAVAAERQVLVVTHLPQVAAFADRQLAVAKQDDGAGVRAGAAELDAEARLVELSRMLSGSPDSTTAQDHAAELLASAARERGR